METPSTEEEQSQLPLPTVANLLETQPGIMVVVNKVG